jgi:hypothetical protein
MADPEIDSIVQRWSTPPVQSGAVSSNNEQPASTEQAPTSLWDKIKGFASGTVESPSVMGTVGGYVGNKLAGPAGAAAVGAVGAETAHIARAVDRPGFGRAMLNAMPGGPYVDYTPGKAAPVESPTEVATDVGKQSAIQGASYLGMKKFFPGAGRTMQKMPSAPPLKIGEAMLGYAVPGYREARAASLVVPPSIRALGRATEAVGNAVESGAGNGARVIGKEAVPNFFGEAASGAYSPEAATAVSHLSQLPASTTVEDLISQGVPVEEAIAAAAKGEPAGMAESLKALYRSSGSTPPPSAYSNAGKFAAEDAGDVIPEDVMNRLHPNGGTNPNPLERILPSGARR